MKEAAGELNMTVVTLIAIAAIGLLFYLFVWPMIQRQIVQQTCSTFGPDYDAVDVTEDNLASCADAPGDCVEATTGGDDSGGAEVRAWCCCRTDDAG